MPRAMESAMNLFRWKQRKERNVGRTGIGEAKEGRPTTCIACNANVSYSTDHMIIHHPTHHLMTLAIVTTFSSAILV